MLFKRPRRFPEVSEGSVFRRVVGGHVVETAKVLSVVRDGAGIPHVRFHVHFERGAPECTDEQRTLALASFAALFPERVPA